MHFTTGERDASTLTTITRHQIGRILCSLFSVTFCAVAPAMDVVHPAIVFGNKVYLTRWLARERGERIHAAWRVNTKLSDRFYLTIE